MPVAEQDADRASPDTVVVIVDDSEVECPVGVEVGHGDVDRTPAGLEGEPRTEELAGHAGLAEKNREEHDDRVPCSVAWDALRRRLALHTYNVLAPQSPKGWVESRGKRTPFGADAFTTRTTL